MASEKKTFLFNAKNGVFTADITATLKVKEVEFDNTTHYWEGDYNTGSVKPMHDKTIIRESEVNFNANLRVLEQYPLHKQMNILMEMLDKSDIPNTENFNKMQEQIKAIKEETEEQKRVYEEDDAFEYIKIESEIAKADKLKDL